ncbi:MAG TPA: hypothetical protein VH143_17710 [Kofleriaceae bacterium]|nr:hypothetical protein [Kofleriaceae bacterium]
MHRARVALVTTIGVAALCYAGLARWTFADEAQQPLVTNPPPVDAAPPPTAVAAAVAAGRHVRIEGPHGAIHVWIPPGFHSDVGATIIYLHGYYDDSDSSYIGHRLPEQFAMSALDAMFIVAETPVAAKTPINYPSLGELLQLVEDKTGVPRGMAYTAVVGHSGAFRTIDAWLDEPLVDELVMIDSMYGNEEQIEAWMRASPRHRLVTVGEDTLIYNENLLRALPDTLVLDRVPTSYETWPAEARTARSVYVRAQFMHMPLVTDGIVLPGVLRLLPIPLLADEPWTQPLGDGVH